MPNTVEQLFDALEHHRILPSAEIAIMRGRWFRPNRKDADDVERFRQWLILNHSLTPFAAAAVCQGNTEQLVLKQYLLRDRLEKGPLAGCLLASDPLNRNVAIEVFTSAAALDKTLEPLAEKLMDLRHPNVGQTLEIDEARGLRYLVREYYDGETLAAILARRGKLPAVQASRIFAFALAGLKALHDAGLSGGDLGADCLMVTAASVGPKGQGRVKLMHAGFRRDLFDNAALIPGSASAAYELTMAAIPIPGTAGPSTPADDLFRLGCTFYQALTGTFPFTPDELARPTREAASVRWHAPETPDMLADIVDQMIAPAPAGQRRASAGNIAKALRVFIAAEAEEKKEKPEDNLTAPVGPAETSTEPDAAAEPAPPEEPEEEAAEPAVAPRRRVRPARPPVEAEEHAEVQGSRLAALWAQKRPDDRDLVFLALGAVLLVALLIALRLVTGWQTINLVCLLAGPALTLLVEQVARWRTRKQQ